MTIIDEDFIVSGYTTFYLTEADLGQIQDSLTRGRRAVTPPAVP
jgi:hypothetical protein